jgi:hypothetical protein
LRVGIILLVIFIFNVSAQETAIEQNNTRISVYLHPFSTSGMVGQSPLYLTVEIPFSLSNSLIIRPSFLNINHVDGDKAFRLGSDIGFRHYLARNGEGLYLQGQMGVFYFRHNNHKCNDECGDVGTIQPFYSVYIPRKSLWLDGMGYIGYSFKFSHVSVFVDAGFGAVLGISTETGNVKLFNWPWPDINMGIGFPF